MIEKIVRDAIHEEVAQSIEKCVDEIAEKARSDARAKVGAITARVFSQVNFMQDENKLVIKVDAKDLTG